MIKVFFPPGCYGTFLTKCLYQMTNLNQSQNRDFIFDEFGSSHDHRNNRLSKQVIDCGHVETLSAKPSDHLVVIFPCVDHHLDYFDNHFCKQERKQIYKYINQLHNVDEVKDKLRLHWNFDHGLNDSTPTWIIREWCSFWIADCLDQSYSIQKYRHLKNSIGIFAQELFENLPELIEKLARRLDLTVLATDWEMKNLQHQFVHHQHWHNIQKKCRSWAEDVVSGTNTCSPCLTIFDEAYVQHLLRQQGFEVQCHDLNSWPDNSRDLHNLIYAV